MLHRVIAIQQADAGENAFHGRHEYVSIQEMQKSVETIEKS
jgi:di/tripeptidase